MIFTETKLKGAFIIDVKRLEDERGFFGRSWCTKEYAEHGLNPNVVQANVSYNKVKGTLRGMHFQRAPFGEGKTVRCTSGGIYDVIIDIRPDSATFKQWISVELTGENYKMLYIPEGFAHGFITLKDQTSVHYMGTAFHTPGAEGGIKFDDPAFNIEWPMKVAVISEKDRNHPVFEEKILNPI